MSEAEARPTNFIRQIIDEDLASGKHTTVHTRFPPEPNGYLHIGHAKSICLNFGIAQDYKARTATAALKRTWRCSKKCVPVVLKKVKPACVLKSTWRRHLS